MNKRKPPGYSSLRKGRVSIPEGQYFLTLCTLDRKRGIHLPDATKAIHRELLHLDADGNIIHRISTVMPDHLHALITLKNRLNISQVVGRLKAKTKNQLLHHGCRWQDNYFEHRLRPDESLLDVFHYIYMNPYRSGLIQADETWAGLLCSSDDWEWFRHHLKDECPHPEWLETESGNG